MKAVKRNTGAQKGAPSESKTGATHMQSGRRGRGEPFCSVAPQHKQRGTTEVSRPRHHHCPTQESQAFENRG